MKRIIYVLILSFLFTSSYARDFSMSSGMLDYSDDQKRSGFIEATLAFKNENNENLFGNFTPISGAMITQDNATMLYPAGASMYVNGSNQGSGGYGSAWSANDIMMIAMDLDSTQKKLLNEGEFGERWKWNMWYLDQAHRILFLSIVRPRIFKSPGHA